MDVHEPITGLVALEARNPSLSAKDLAERMKGQIRAMAAVYSGMNRAETGARIEAGAFSASCSRARSARGKSGVRVER